jgi:hypothetical protein
VKKRVGVLTSGEAVRNSRRRRKNLADTERLPAELVLAAKRNSRAVNTNLEHQRSRAELSRNCCKEEKSVMMQILNGESRLAAGKRRPVFT